jgi:hypothetical protein
MMNRKSHVHIVASQSLMKADGFALGSLEPATRVLSSLMVTGHSVAQAALAIVLPCKLVMLSLQIFTGFRNPVEREADSHVCRDLRVLSSPSVTPVRIPDGVFSPLTSLEYL